MKSIGIVCECNPFHAGHEYLFRSARASGADAVVAVMSGCFTQRGEAAVADPWLRAEALLASGADLVLELPYPYSASSAEFFGGAGVEILDRLGVNELWFGSECGDLARLESAAALCESDSFAALYAETVQKNSGTAQAFLETLQRLCGTDELFLSNDILGISYLRAIRARGGRMGAVTVKREGSAYLEEALHQNEYPSATALRRVWREEGTTAVLPHLPKVCREVYARVEELPKFNAIERLILGHLRLTPPAELEKIAELSGGLGARLAKIACEASTLDELLRLSATKKYPTSRLRRGILFALTGVTGEDLRRAPAYTRLLAANERGCRFLANTRKTGEIPMLTRRTELPSDPATARQEELERRAYALYDLCFSTVGKIPSPWSRMPVIVNDK